MKLRDHVCGGYFLVRRDSPRRHAPRLPDVSVSYDFVEFMPDSWLLNWSAERLGRRREMAREAGLNMAKFTEAATWMTDQFDHRIGWPHVFFTVSDAHWFRAAFLTDPASYTLLGIGMPKPLLTQSRDHITNYYPQGEGLPGIYHILRQEQPLAGPHLTLGYDILHFDIGSVFKSWLLTVLMDNNPFIRPYLNRHRFIRHYRDAFRLSKQAITEYHTDEPIVGIDEWMPWLMVRYPDHPAPMP